MGQSYGGNGHIVVAADYWHARQQSCKSPGLERILQHTSLPLSSSIFFVGNLELATLYGDSLTVMTRTANAGDVSKARGVVPTLFQVFVFLT